MIHGRSLACTAVLAALFGIACGSSGDDAEASGGGGTGGSAAAAGGQAADGGAGETGKGGSATAGGGSAQGGTAQGGAAGGPAAGQGGGAGFPGGSSGGGGTPRPLDMNDVTVLVPLPADPSKPVIASGTDVADDGTALVPSALYDRLVAGDETTFGQAVLPPDFYGELQLVAARFDLCDRAAPGVCPEGDDARLRLVFQPVEQGAAAFDAGFHGFYSVPAAEAGEVVAKLRALAQLAPASQGGALRPSPALSGESAAAYAAGLRALVMRYGGESRLVRLTMNAQPLALSQIRWSLRGVEKKSGAFVDMTIPGSGATSEAVIMNGPLFSPGYEVSPATDTPSGLAGALDATMFAVGSDDAKKASLLALTAVENPLTHSSETVACVACHTSTVLLHTRGSLAGVDPATLPGRYASTYDLSVSWGQSQGTGHTLRALGYLGKAVMISQRVANDTAQTLSEIEARFPASP